MSLTCGHFLVMSSFTVLFPRAGFGGTTPVATPSCGGHGPAAGIDLLTGLPGRAAALAGSTVVLPVRRYDLVIDAEHGRSATLRRVAFPVAGRGWFGLTPTYVARLKSAASRDGAAALAGQGGPGCPRALGEDKQDLARQWRAQGESDLGDRPAAGRGGYDSWAAVAWQASRRQTGAGLRQEELELAPPGLALAPGRQPEPGPGDDSGREQQEPRVGPGLAAEPAGAAPGGAGDGPPSRCRARAVRGSPAGCSGRGTRARCRLRHAFQGPCRGGQVLESAAGAGRGAGGYRFADVALLSATSMCFALGAHSAPAG